MKKITILAIMLLASSAVFSQTTLSYKFDKPAKYLQTSKIHQVMDVMGQTMDVNVESVLGCNLRAVEKKTNGLVLEVTVDTLAQIIDSPNGRAGGPSAGAKGKSFRMEITPQGKITDMSDAKKITFNVEGAGPIDMSGLFFDFIPVLPVGKIKNGYTWTSVDTLSTGSNTNSQSAIMNSNNKFEGFETIMGVNCARIISVVEGTTVMKNQAQGMDMTTSGAVNGTVTSWIDPDRGVLVRLSSTSRLTGQIEITSPENITFPVTMDITTTNELQK